MLGTSNSLVSMASDGNIYDEMSSDEESVGFPPAIDDEKESSPIPGTDRMLSVSSQRLDEDKWNDARPPLPSGIGSKQPPPAIAVDFGRFPSSSPDSPHSVDRDSESSPKEVELVVGKALAIVDEEKATSLNFTEGNAKAIDTCHECCAECFSAVRRCDKVPLFCCACVERRCVCTCTDFCEVSHKFFKDLFALKSILFPALVHFTDQASDIGVLVLFYRLWQAQRRARNDDSSDKTQVCAHLNMAVMFFCSLASIIMYRALSTLLIYRMTRDCKRVFRQLLDWELLEAIRINFDMGLNAPSNPMRWLSHLEAIFEASPQSLVHFVFLAKTDNFTTSGRSVVAFSFFFSLLAIVNRMAAEDATVFANKWKSSEINFKCYVCCKPKNPRFPSHKPCSREYWCSKKRVEEEDSENSGVLLVTLCGVRLNAYFAERRLWRALDVTLRVLIVSFVWLCIGGTYVFVLLFVDACILAYAGIQTKNWTFVGGLVGTLFVRTSDFTRSFSRAFFVYRKTLHLAILVICSFLISTDVETCFQCPSFYSRRMLWHRQSTRYVFIYCWVAYFAHYLWWYRIRNGLQQKGSTDRNIYDLLLAGDMKGLAQLVAFGMKIDDQSGTEEALLKTISLAVANKRPLNWIDTMESLIDLNENYKWNPITCTECCSLRAFDWWRPFRREDSDDTMRALGSLSSAPGGEDSVVVDLERNPVTPAFDMHMFCQKLMKKCKNESAEFSEFFAPMLSGVWLHNPETHGCAIKEFFAIMRNSKKRKYREDYERTVVKLFEAKSYATDHGTTQTVLQQMLAVGSDDHNAVWRALIDNIPVRASLWKDADTNGWNAFMFALKNQTQVDVWRRFLLSEHSSLRSLAKEEFTELWTAKGFGQNALQSGRQSLCRRRRSRLDTTEKLNALAIAIRHQSEFEVWKLLIQHCHLTADVWGASFGRGGGLKAENGFWFACRNLENAEVWKLLIDNGAILDTSIWKKRSALGHCTARIFLENAGKHLSDDLLQKVVDNVTDEALLYSRKNSWDLMDSCYELELGAKAKVRECVWRKTHRLQHVFCLQKAQFGALKDVNEFKLLKAVQKALNKADLEPTHELYRFALAQKLPRYLMAANFVRDESICAFGFQTLANGTGKYYGEFLTQVLESKYDTGFLWRKEDVRQLIRDFRNAVPSQTLSDFGLNPDFLKPHAFLHALLEFVTKGTDFECTAAVFSRKATAFSPMRHLTAKDFEFTQTQVDFEFEGAKDCEEYISTLETRFAAKRQTKLFFADQKCQTLCWRQPGAGEVELGDESKDESEDKCEEDSKGDAYNSRLGDDPFAVVLTQPREFEENIDNLLHQIVDMLHLTFELEPDEVNTLCTVATKVDDFTFALGKLQFHSEVPFVATLWRLFVNALVKRSALRRLSAENAIEHVEGGGESPSASFHEDSAFAQMRVTKSVQLTAHMHSVKIGSPVPEQCFSDSCRMGDTLSNPRTRKRSLIRMKGRWRRHSATPRQRSARAQTVRGPKRGDFFKGTKEEQRLRKKVSGMQLEMARLKREVTSLKIGSLPLALSSSLVIDRESSSDPVDSGGSMRPVLGLNLMSAPVFEMLQPSRERSLETAMDYDESQSEDLSELDGSIEGPKPQLRQFSASE